MLEIEYKVSESEITSDMHTSISSWLVESSSFPASVRLSSSIVPLHHNKDSMPLTDSWSQFVAPSFLEVT